MELSLSQDRGLLHPNVMKVRFQGTMDASLHTSLRCGTWHVVWLCHVRALSRMNVLPYVTECSPDCFLNPKVRAVVSSSRDLRLKLDLDRLLASESASEPGQGFTWNRLGQGTRLEATQCVTSRCT